MTIHTTRQAWFNGFGWGLFLGWGAGMLTYTFLFPIQ
jgi:hypothetical protein